MHGGGCKNKIQPLHLTTVIKSGLGAARDAAVKANATKYLWTGMGTSENKHFHGAWKSTFWKQGVYRWHEMRLAPVSQQAQFQFLPDLRRRVLTVTNPVSNPSSSLTTQFGIHHAGYIYNMMHMSPYIPLWIYLKWTEIPKYKPQHQKQNARKEQIFISHQLMYWMPSAPKSTLNLSDFGISDIYKKMPYNDWVGVMSLSTHVMVGITYNR